MDMHLASAYLMSVYLIRHTSQGHILHGHASQRMFLAQFSEAKSSAKVVTRSPGSPCPHSRRGFWPCDQAWHLQPQIHLRFVQPGNSGPGNSASGLFGDVLAHLRQKFDWYLFFARSHNHIIFPNMSSSRPVGLKIPRSRG